MGQVRMFTYRDKRHRRAGIEPRTLLEGLEVDIPADVSPATDWQRRDRPHAVCHTHIRTPPHRVA